jgi:hypothetical protein
MKEKGQKKRENSRGKGVETVIFRQRTTVKPGSVRNIEPGSRDVSIEDKKLFREKI